MNIGKAITGLVVTVGLAVGLGTGANAQLTAIAISGGNTTAQNVTYTSGGDLVQATTDGFITSKFGLGTANPVVINLSTLTPNGYTFNSGTGVFDQSFNGGNFSVTNTAGTITYLAGTFDGSDLTGVNGGTSGGLNLKLSSVTYNPASTFLPAGFSPNNGSLALEFTLANGSVFSANSTALGSFGANDGITYSAQKIAVPEPGTYAAFLIGGLGVLGLMVGARKRSAIA